MAGNRNKMAGHRTRVVVLTADSAFEQSASATFAASPQIDLTVVAGTLAMNEGAFDLDESTIFIIDIDAGQQDEMDALARLMAEIAGRPPVVVVTQSFDAAVARQLLQMRVADFMVKPVVPADLARTCARVVQDRNETEQAEAEIYTFLPAVGGAGVTTLSIQTALLLLSSGQKTRTSTCLVDLDFQHGACADYLDLEPRGGLDGLEAPPAGGGPPPHPFIM